MIGIPLCASCAYFFSLSRTHVNYCCNHHGEELQCKAGLEVEPPASTDGLVAHPPAATAMSTAADEDDGTLSALETHAQRLAFSDSETLLPNSSSVKKMNLSADINDTYYST